MSLEKFKEECAFIQFKDKCFKNATTCKGNILKKFNDIDVNNLYIRIVNYQIKTYGDILRGRHVLKTN